MFEEFALMMLGMWPIIPVSLIQLHSVPRFWRKIGTWTYLVFFLEWLPIIFVVSSLQNVLLQNVFQVTAPVIASGVFLIAAGIVLHSWTAKLLGIKATIGYTEITSAVDADAGKLIISGPFSVVRHPSYWAHTSILVGTFLVTGVVAIGVVAIIDFLITYFITTELEDRELVQRFGDAYREYQRKVPKVIPKI